ncbi:MAG: DUF1932 domain-containing protein [Anaerolineales bacterium]|nr:DUF1932 domain-containing protein [Anaerolineales bacterium]
MHKMSVGLLHPGEMGVSVGASAMRSGHPVYWASEGRSTETSLRAQKSNLVDLGTLTALCARVEVVLSICPPHAAEEVLDDVIGAGFSGIYVDANAISPQKSMRLAAKCSQHGLEYVDGAIVGGPAWQSGSTHLYLSGDHAGLVARLFDEGLLETCLLGDQPGRASALKMCFAAYSKGSTALVTMFLAASTSLGVREELMKLWSLDGSTFAEEAEMRALRVTRKAWRFAGEMDEIADTFAGEGLPDGFHQAAHEIYARLSHFKDRKSLPALDEVVTSLLEPRRDHVGERSS